MTTNRVEKLFVDSDRVADQAVERVRSLEPKPGHRGPLSRRRAIVCRPPLPARPQAAALTLAPLMGGLLVTSILSGQLIGVDARRPQAWRASAFSGRRLDSPVWSDAP